MPASNIQRSRNKLSNNFDFNLIDLFSNIH